MEEDFSSSCSPLQGDAGKELLRHLLKDKLSPATTPSPRAQTPPTARCQLSNESVHSEEEDRLGSQGTMVSRVSLLCCGPDVGPDDDGDGGPDVGPDPLPPASSRRTARTFWTPPAGRRFHVARGQPSLRRTELLRRPRGGRRRTRTRPCCPRSPP